MVSPMPCDLRRVELGWPLGLKQNPPGPPKLNFGRRPLNLFPLPHNTALSTFLILDGWVRANRAGGRLLFL